LRELSGWSAIAVALTVREEILGVLCFGLAGRSYTLADLAVAEELARRAALALDNARLYRDVQEASRLKDEFLSIVSHELRTPLNAIIGWSRMLRTGSVREGNQEHALDIIERNASLQTRLIDDLLDVSRIIAGKLRLDITPTDIVPVVETVIESVNPALLAKDIQLKKKLHLPNRPVLADASRLKQVVWNLLSNAIKFTPKGGTIEVSLDCTDEEARLVVSDNGRGIHPSFLPHVFDRFRQADSTLTRQSGGLGLGLAIVRHLVEAHGGTVRADSAGPNAGSAFTVKVPLARSELLSAVVSSSPADPSLHWTPMLTGTSVLVVEDQADTREILEEVLLQAGAEVKVAADAREAMDILHNWTPDVLVSDIAMPGEDGYSLIRRVRTMEVRQGRSISAVALTAYARAEDRVQALAAGYQMHVPKPVDPRELVLTISSLSGRPRSPPPSSGLTPIAS
jgi:signal transduction histidine kinase/ActR/RegA family two-component response regulator